MSWEMKNGLESAEAKETPDGLTAEAKPAADGAGKEEKAWDAGAGPESAEPEEAQPEAADWRERALRAEAEVESLRAAAPTPRIVTGGGESPEEDCYSREEIRNMSPQEINSRWQGIRRSLKRLI